MNHFTIFTLCVTISMASARPQFGSPFFPNQGGFQNQGGQGFPSQGGFQNQGGQGFPNQGGFQNQGGQGFPNQSGFQNQGNFQPNPNNPFFGNTSPNPDITTNGSLGVIGQQQNQFGNQPGQFQNPVQTQVTSTTPAAAPSQSPAFLRCTRDCLTTNEYNPVCGSDQVAYNNVRRLDCANQCGRRLIRNWQEVTVVRSGACTSGQRVS